MKVYGADKVWRQLARQGTSVARRPVRPQLPGVFADLP